MSCPDGNFFIFPSMKFSWQLNKEHVKSPDKMFNMQKNYVVKIRGSEMFPEIFHVEVVRFLLANTVLKIVFHIELQILVRLYIE